jgi:hypothetical protein
MPIFRHSIRRSSRRERARRIDRAFEIFLKGFLLCYFLFVLSAWLSYRPTWRIVEIRVLGTQAVDPALVEGIARTALAHHLLWKIDRNNAVLYPWREIQRATKMLDTHVKGVKTRVDGKQLTISVSEYVSAFLWCPPDSFGETGAPLSDTQSPTTTPLTAATTEAQIVGCSFADETGHIFAAAPGYSGNPFLVFVTTLHKESNGAVLSAEEFKKMNMFLDKLKGLGLTPHMVRESGMHDFTITTGEPWVVRWSSERDPETDARTLALVLQNMNGDHAGTSTLKSVDLRFGNKVFYR